MDHSGRGDHGHALVTQPPETPLWFYGWKVFQAIGAVLIAMFVWLVKREIKRVDDTLHEHAGKIGELQLNRVTKDDMDELRASLTATVTNGFQLLDRRVDVRHEEHLERYREGRDDMQYIRERLDRLLDRK